MKFSQNLPKEEKPEAFHALMREVAAELGGYRYTPQPPADTYDWQVKGHLDHPGKNIGLSVRLNIDGYQASGKMDISGVYARGPKNEAITPSRLTAPTMSCSPERPVRTIAADIRRRMIVPYIPYAQAVEEVAAAMTERQRKIDAAKKELEELGFKFQNSNEKAYSSGAFYSVATLYSDQRTDLEIRGLNARLIGVALQAIQNAAAI